MRKAEEKFSIVLLRNLAGALAIVWMCVIFAFSAQTKEESGAVSESFSDERVREIADAIEGMVRKAAHMAEYGILSVLLYIWIGQWEMSFLRRGGTAVGATAVYAATDEFHQLFVAGRSGRISDVCIDSAGALAGVVVFVLLAKFVKYVRAKRERRGERNM